MKGGVLSPAPVGECDKEHKNSVLHPLAKRKIKKY